MDTAVKQTAQHETGLAVSPERRILSGLLIHLEHIPDDTLKHVAASNYALGFIDAEHARAILAARRFVEGGVA